MTEEQQTEIMSGFRSSINDLRTNQQLFDFKIMLGERAYPVHKVVLAANSDYFRAMFLNEMKEAEENEVTIDDVDPYIMKLIIDFCYTQRISLNEENYLDVLSAASRFCMKFLLDVCVEYLSTIMNVSNCLHLIDISDKYKLPSLGESAAKFVAKNLREIIKRPEFDDISELHWFVIWSEKSRPEDVEDELFEKFVHWTEKDPEKRGSIFDELSKHVKHSSMKLTKLIELSWLDTVKNSRACRELMNKEKKHRLMDLHELLTKLSSRRFI